MKAEKLKSLVAEAIALDAAIARDEARLKEMKKKLSAEAADRPDAERTETDLGGWSIVLDGGDAGVARVTKAARALKGSLDPDSDEGKELLDLCDEHADVLFERKSYLAPVEKFRGLVMTLFSTAKAAKIIKVFSSSGKTTVSFETKEKA